MASAKQVDPPPEWWSAERDLMAAVVDRLNVLIWQQTKDGHEGRNAPQPMHRPGAAPARPRDVNPAERKARLLKMAGRGSTAA